MNNLSKIGIGSLLAWASVALVGFANSAMAGTMDFPAGLACPFGLHVDFSGGNQHEHHFLDKNGNLVRILTTGTGSALTFTNIDTGATLSLKSNGSGTDTRINADGSSLVTLHGHNILILFPTDKPAGPTTTLYVGRAAFTVDTSGNFTLGDTSGQSTDICAALS